MIIVCLALCSRSLDWRAVKECISNHDILVIARLNKSHLNKCSKYLSRQNIPVRIPGSGGVVIDPSINSANFDITPPIN